jgi:hypothetical protein
MREIEPRRCARKLIAASVICVVGVASFGCRRFYAPETPANALLEWQGKILDGEIEAAWDRMCTDVKADALLEPSESLFTTILKFRRFQGQFYTDWEPQVSGATARVPITVQPLGAVDSRGDELWIATMEKQRRKWRVCSFQRLGRSALREKRRDE